MEELLSIMNIMAMPWVEEADTFEYLIDKISKLFSNNDLSSQYVITNDKKPHQRVVATIPIFSDFYLDISTIKSDTYGIRTNEKKEKNNESKNI